MGKKYLTPWASLFLVRAFQVFFGRQIFQSSLFCVYYCLSSPHLISIYYIFWLLFNTKIWRQVLIWLLHIAIKTNFSFCLFPVFTINVSLTTISKYLVITKRWFWKSNHKAKISDRLSKMISKESKHIIIEDHLTTKEDYKRVRTKMQLKTRK